MQFDTVRGLPTIASRFPGQGSAFDLRAQRQIEACAQEIFNAHATGLDKNPSRMRDAWNELHSQWMTLSARDKAPVKDLYDQAYAIVAAIPGIGKLHYLHLP